MLDIYMISRVFYTLNEKTSDHLVRIDTFGVGVLQ